MRGAHNIANGLVWQLKQPRNHEMDNMAGMLGDAPNIWGNLIDANFGVDMSSPDCVTWIAISTLSFGSLGHLCGIPSGVPSSLQPRLPTPMFCSQNESGDISFKPFSL